MNHSSLVFGIFLSVISLTPTITNAEVIDRGNGLLYDSDQDLTWMQNANVNGAMKWAIAMAWAEDLVYQGFDDWRLPTTTQFDDPTCLEDVRAPFFFESHSGCLGGEMEQLTASSDPYNNPLFENVNRTRYWTATPYRDGIDPCVAGDFCILENDSGIRNDFYWQWAFTSRDFEGPYKTTLGGGNPRPAWAVRDGDVVPADSSGVLMANLSFHTPSLNYQTKDGILNIWANLSPYGTGPNNELIWALTAFGVNKTAFTGSMTGEVSENLSITIRSLNFQDSSYWATFKYYGNDKETYLWELMEYGINQ